MKALKMGQWNTTRRATKQSGPRIGKVTKPSVLTTLPQPVQALTVVFEIYSLAQASSGHQLYNAPCCRIHWGWFTQHFERIVLDTVLSMSLKYPWTYERKINHQFIQPGKSNQNADVESFNGNVRDESLNEHWWRNIDHNRNKIERWREDYNQVRPHSSLNKQTPQAFAEKSRARP